MEVTLAPDLPALRLDPVLFEQVLFNLLDNAAKYSPGGTAVSIMALSEGARVRIEIADEGSGLPPADLERIFDKFYRAQAADSRRAGTGLDACDLPRVRGGDGRHHRGGQPRGQRRGVHDPAAGRRTRGSGSGMNTLRILAVDDEPAIRRLLRTSKGYDDMA